MPGHLWLDGLRQDLAHRGLPAAYIARFIQELDDHMQDLLQEQEAIMSTEAKELPSGPVPAQLLEQRLGNREELGEQAVALYRQSSFVGRHPVWTFLLAPIPAALVCWGVFFLVGVLACTGFGRLLGGGSDLLEGPGATWPSLLTWTVRAMHFLGAFLPPAVVALLWGHMARRSGRGWPWGLASCLLVALVTGAFVSQLELPTAATRGRLLFGIGLVTQWRQLVQLAVPLLIGGYYLVREHRDSRRMSLRTER